MKLKEIGERKITYEIAEKFSIPYDDCYFLPLNKELLLLTTDMVYKKTHFPEGTTFYQMGWYSIAVNVSDIVAKGGEPIAYLVALGLPREMDKKSLNEILDGMKDCIKIYGGKLVGGDTKETDEITIVVAAIGKVKKEECMARKGAKPGDALYVTGKLGKGGVALLEKDLEKLLLIKPRIKEAKIIAKEATSCMDLSDGLASSLYQLSTINKVGFRIYADLLPLDELAKKYENWLDLALYYGGDYELLFTISEKKGKELERKIDIKKIGEVIDEKKILLIRKGKECEIENRGYEHFIE